jgi:putative transposase
VFTRYQDKVACCMLLVWIGYNRSSWYYIPRHGKKGIRPSTHTSKSTGELVSNEQVLLDIKSILTGDLEFYGYEKVTWELHDLEYIINKKKVYRLMSEANLLLIRERIKTSGKRQFVQFRCIDAQRPLQYLVMDIKYVYIHQEKKFAYLLTILDVFSRFAVGHTLKYSIRKHDVILLLDGVLQGLNTEGIIIRNDNGSQFLAHNVRQYLKDNNITQEFTHIATPEENSYIESFHSNISRELINRCWFDSIYHARLKINEYYRIYNYKRKHRSLKRKSPHQYIKYFFPEYADKHPFAFSESLSRAALAEGMNGAAACLALDKQTNENAKFVKSEIQEILLN